MRLIVFLLGLLLSVPLFAQDDVEVTAYPGRKSNSDSIRSLHIQRYPDHFFIWPVIKQRSLNFEVESLKGGQKLNFKPNNAFTIGLGAYLFDIGAELTFAVPKNSASNEQYGKTKSTDIQLNILSKKFGLDMYYQTYNGFYEVDPTLKILANQPYPQRSDIYTRNYGVSGIYIFNNKKFSFRSAYNFAERQLKSGGSFLLVGTLNSFKLTADSSVLNKKQRAVYGENSSFKDLTYTTFSIAPGYAYSVIYRNFFINGTLAFGPAHNWIYFRRNNDSDKHDISINTYVTARIGLGYNSDHFFAGINFVTQARSIKFEDIRFTNSSDTFKLLLGYRFREIGFLKKSVLDLKDTVFK